MEILTKYELRLRKREILEKIRKGAIFIHPTDTIYGIGCNALNEQAVKKIRKIKERPTTPFSIWAPSHNWIKQNCYNSPNLDKWLKELPSAHTLILKIKNTNSIAPNVNLKNQTLGIRIPDHWFHTLVEELNVPIVTTSVNRQGETFMTSLEDLDPEIKRKVDFLIYEGEKKARPSKLVNLSIDKETITKR